MYRSQSKLKNIREANLALEKRLLSEQKKIKDFTLLFEQQDMSTKMVPGTGGDPYQYLQYQGKYFYAKKGATQWTEAKGDLNDPKSPAGAIKSRYFPATASSSATTATTSATTATTQVASGTTSGNTTTSGTTLGTTSATTPSQLVGLSKLPTDVQARITKWSQSPAGTYILSLPPEQREAGLDNLDRRRGDQETRDLRKDIRIALGMAADKFLGRVQQGAQGLAQGFKQGFQGGVPPTNQ